jgi:hypothetical protein
MTIGATLQKMGEFHEELDAPMSISEFHNFSRYPLEAKFNITYTLEVDLLKAMLPLTLVGLVGRKWVSRNWCVHCSQPDSMHTIYADPVVFVPLTKKLMGSVDIRACYDKALEKLKYLFNVIRGHGPEENSYDATVIALAACALTQEGMSVLDSPFRIEGTSGPCHVAGSPPVQI